MPKPLIVMALESESQGLLEAAGFPVLYAGVGKVNSAYRLASALARLPAPPALVLNLGTAGSTTFPFGAVVGADRFVERDMDASGIGFPKGTTPFDDTPALLEFPKYFPELPHGICGSGDSFLQGASPVPCDIIEMEAFALAKVCYHEKIPFAAVKYITDGADGNAATDWQENLRHAAEAFVQLLKKQAY